MIHSVNIRAFKDQLSAHLRYVKQGDIVLVTDRGKVVAEVRQPSVGRADVARSLGNKAMLIADGTLTEGVPNTANAYQDADIAIETNVIDRALAATRGER